MLLPEAIANHVNISWAASHNVLVTNPGWFENCRHIADMALVQIWSGFPTHSQGKWVKWGPMLLLV